MSEYLKWYSSHDAWSQMKEQAKIEIEDLTKQLAKANERIAELEKWVAGVSDSHSDIPDWVQQAASR